MTKSLQLTRRSLLRLTKGAIGLAAGMSVFGSSASRTLASEPERPQASSADSEAAIKAIEASDDYSSLATALRARGFATTDMTRQDVLVDTAGLIVTLAASSNSVVRAAFISGVVSPTTFEVLSVFASVFERANQYSGWTTILRARAGSIAEQRQEVAITRHCPPNQICPDADSDPGGGCVGCCGGWYQVGYILCQGLTQYDCVALRRFCCCCNNATTCWYEQTGDTCYFNCTAGCYPGQCPHNACGGCA